VALSLEGLRGVVGDDGVERLTTQAVLDVLQVPQRSRRRGVYVRLAKLMTDLGWTAVRVRGMTRAAIWSRFGGFAATGGLDNNSSKSASIYQIDDEDGREYCER
jgi:hypothetical protein